MKILGPVSYHEVAEQSRNKSEEGRKWKKGEREREREKGRSEMETFISGSFHK